MQLSLFRHVDQYIGFIFSPFIWSPKFQVNILGWQFHICNIHSQTTSHYLVLEELSDKLVRSLLFSQLSQQQEFAQTSSFQPNYSCFLRGTNKIQCANVLLGWANKTFCIVHVLRKVSSRNFVSRDNCSFKWLFMTGLESCRNAWAQRSCIFSAAGIPFPLVAVGHPRCHTLCGSVIPAHPFSPPLVLLLLQRPL